MNQAIDYHAILPELILSGTIVLVLVVDAFLAEAHVARDAARVRSASSPRSSRRSR